MYFRNQLRTNHFLGEKIRKNWLAILFVLSLGCNVILGIVLSKQIDSNFRLNLNLIEESLAHRFVRDSLTHAYQMLKDHGPVARGDIQIYYESVTTGTTNSSTTSEDKTIELKCGQSIDFIADVHSSVGRTFDLICDSASFIVRSYTIYHNPESVEMGMCGGDRATQTIKLTPIKVGQQLVKCVEGWRGSIANETEYTIIVR